MSRGSCDWLFLDVLSTLGDTPRTKRAREKSGVTGNVVTCWGFEAVYLTARMNSCADGSGFSPEFSKPITSLHPALEPPDLKCVPSV